MTYCLGIALPAGLVLASDSRTNAGVDQIATVRKLSLFENSGKSVIALLGAGNLATTQAVGTIIRQNLETADPLRDLFALGSMFEVAQLVGTVLREVLARDGDFVRPFGDPGASFLVAGQVVGEPPRLFQIYTAGNFVEATPRNCFLQIGETKYGKPILDRSAARRHQPRRGRQAGAAVVRRHHPKQPVGRAADRHGVLRTGQLQLLQPVEIHRRRSVLDGAAPRLQRGPAGGGAGAARAAAGEPRPADAGMTTGVRVL